MTTAGREILPESNTLHGIEAHPAHRGVLWGLLAAFASASVVLGAQDPGLVLNPASTSGSAFNFTLSAESGVSYIIQASSNLVDWVTLGTNTDPGITRTITITNPPADGSYYRAVRGPLPLFGFALAASNQITLSGATIVDSFDSTDPNYSTNGLYTASRRKAGAIVATDSNANPAIDVRGSHIYGMARTGPAGTVTLSLGGAVGDLNWTTGIEPGYASNDMNVAYPDNVAPRVSTGWLPPLPGTVGTNAFLYQYVLGNGNYMLSSLTISQSGSGNPVIVTGNATLFVTGNITVAGSGYIQIAPGASLTLIEGGSTATISGGGVINGTGLAKNFSYIGLRANTALTYAGAAMLIGTVNAPEAALTLSGSAAWSGAGIARTINEMGGASIHYDESLARTGPTR